MERYGKDWQTFLLCGRDRKIMNKLPPTVGKLHTPLGRLVLPSSSVQLSGVMMALPLFQVNGTSLIGCSHTKAVRILKQISGSLVLTISRWLLWVLFPELCVSWGCMYLWWSLCTLCLLKVRVTAGDSGLCCVCVTSFERYLTPLCGDSACQLEKSNVVLVENSCQLTEW